MKERTLAVGKEDMDFRAMAEVEIKEAGGHLEEEMVRIQM